ncbi:DUF1653 domain-containing protein [Candidatus Parcubacteria bacterium]|nr:DUF1653 domain-containing protein [Candidatus Parcubacteria bacterium]
MPKKSGSERPADWPKNGFYYHFKHTRDGPINEGAYEVVGVGRMTESKDENPELMVIYRQLYEHPTPIPGRPFELRPLKMFTGTIRRAGYSGPRFVRITNQNVIDRLIWVRKQMYPEAAPL